jgi:translation initiation factor IF-2
VKIRIIHTGVGAINESDVLLATASNAIIIGFNVRPDRNAADVAEREKVDIRHHSVIYHVTDEMKKAMAGLLAPTLKETRMGRRKCGRRSSCRRPGRLQAAWCSKAG